MLCAQYYLSILEHFYIITLSDIWAGHQTERYSPILNVDDKENSRIRDRAPTHSTLMILPRKKSSPDLENHISIIKR